MPKPTEDIVRYIGVDFGTSTSVLCYKDYQGKKEFSGIQTPAIDPASGRNLVPTVIYDEPGGGRLYGAAAEKRGVNKPDRMHRNFKMDLVSSDAKARHRAEELMDDFFAFLYGRYRETSQQMTEHELASEHTYVSYPAKWPDTVRQRTLEAARKAGFPDVKGVDEPSAAMQAVVLTRNPQTDALIARGVIHEDRALNVLLLDMGAGTTDLVLYRYQPQADEQKVLATWPPVDNPGTFGGREVDAVLTGYLQRWLQGRLPGVSQVKGLLDQSPIEVRRWKEELSRELRRVAVAEVVPEFLRGVTALHPEFTPDSFPPLSRDEVGKQLDGYLGRLPTLVRELLEHATALGSIGGGDDVDVVVLTGGHCQWFFVKEILAGRWIPGLPGSAASGSGVRLGKIGGDTDRIVEMAQPQETVAQGLALMGSPIRIAKLASNRAWLRLKVSVSDSVDIQMVDVGERLPVRKKFAFKRFDARYRPAQSIPVEWTPLFGTELRTARAFDTDRFALETTDLVEVFAAFFAEKFGGIIDDTAEVAFEVSVDETEHLTAVGLLKGGDGFDDVKFFAINRDEPTPAEQAELRRKHQRQRSL
jgi:molecular chaperone DnaK (HSP70)